MPKPKRTGQNQPRGRRSCHWYEIHLEGKVPQLPWTSGLDDRRRALHDSQVQIRRPILISLQQSTTQETLALSSIDQLALDWR